MADHEIDTVPGEPLVNTDPLRNAPLLSESDTEEEHSAPPRVYHLEPVVPHHIVAWQMTQRYALETYLWLQFFWSVLTYVTSKSIVVGKSVVRSLQPQHYIYFKGSEVPYRSQDYTVTGPGIAPIEWYYDADKYLFISSSLYTSSTEYETRHLPWLSAEIKYNDMTLYDITDHVEQVRFASSSGSPPPGHILSAWSLKSCIVLDGKDGLVLHTLNEDGSESQINIRG